MDRRDIEVLRVRLHEQGWDSVAVIPWTHRVDGSVCCLCYLDEDARVTYALRLEPHAELADVERWFLARLPPPNERLG